MKDHGVNVDFVYDPSVAVFIDGPPHDDLDQRAKDRRLRTDLEDAGWSVIPFHHAADWREVFAQYPSVFGVVREGPRTSEAPAAGPEVAADDGWDDEYVAERFRPLIRVLRSVAGLEIEPGGDVSADGRVVGSEVAVVRVGGTELHLVDAEQVVASSVIAALESRGLRALRITGDDGEADRVLESLRG